MSSTYSDSLRVELVGPGDQAGAWGTTTNNNFNYIFDKAIAGYLDVDITTSPHTLTSVSGPTSSSNLNQSIYASLRFINAVAASTVYAPAVPKTYVIWNNSGYAVTLYNTGYSTGPTIADGARIMVFSTGTAFYEVLPQSITGVLPVTKGGTGATTFTSGALLKGAGTSAVSVASAADIVSQIGSTAVTNATNLVTTNWATSETTATQTALITIASPAVVTVVTAPADLTAVSFSTTGALPTGITANAAYYVWGRTSTTYRLSVAQDVSQTASITIDAPDIAVVAAPQNDQLVNFTTTGSLPTGLSVGTYYYVVNRTATSFQVSATSGGAAITPTGSQSGIQTAIWRTPLNTSGSQSGTQTETTSKLYFKYKTLDRMSIDLGGNLAVTGNVTAYSTP
jgi:hypothetical protein